MRLTDLHRRRLRTILGWAGVLGLGVGTALVYRWAEPRSPMPAPLQNASAQPDVTIRLENAPFVGHSNGFKTWSLLAKRIDVERVPGSSVTTIESVALTGIKDGLLYPAPPTSAEPPAPAPAVSPTSGQTALNRIPTEAELPYGPWTGKFRAEHGHYRSGLMSLPPPELALLYRLQSQLDLTQGVDFRTREGDHFEAESLAVLDLIHKQTGRPERRILCDNGMKVTRKDAQMTANQARFDVSERMVECLGGARATYPDGTLQSERMYWSLDAAVLRCPETVTGTWNQVPFVAQGLTIDMKNRTIHANQIQFELRSDTKEKLQSLEKKGKGIR